MMYDCLQLKPDVDGVNYFSGCHKMGGNDYASIYRLVNLWSNGFYYVFCPTLNGAPIGIIHGDLSRDNFYLHVFFFEEYRGKKAVAGFKKFLTVAKTNLPIQNFYAKINEDNKLARMFGTMVGAKTTGDGMYVINKDDVK